MKVFIITLVILLLENIVEKVCMEGSQFTKDPFMSLFLSSRGTEKLEIGILSSVDIDSVGINVSPTFFFNFTIAFQQSLITILGLSLLSSDK